MTSTFAMPPNTYDVFATGDAKLTDMGTIPPTPLDAVTICSPVVSVFVPPNWSPAPLLPNTTQVTKTYATMNFTQGTGRANGVFTGKANASDNGTFIAPPAVTRVNQPTRPVMVVLPTLGGPFEQPNAPWGVYQAPNTPATISTLQLPAATGYNIYMFCKGNVYPDGDTTQPPSNDFQLICTPMLLNQ